MVTDTQRYSTTSLPFLGVPPHSMILFYHFFFFKRWFFRFLQKDDVVFPPPQRIRLGEPGPGTRLFSAGLGLGPGSRSRTSDRAPGTRLILSCACPPPPTSPNPPFPCTEENSTEEKKIALWRGCCGTQTKHQEHTTLHPLSSPKEKTLFELSIVST